MLKLLDKLGEWLLRLFRFLLFTKKARQHLNPSDAVATNQKADAKRTLTAYADQDAGRQDLIANAVSLHRSRQEVLATLDDESRKKLSEMAETMLPLPDKQKPPGKKS